MKSYAILVRGKNAGHLEHRLNHISREMAIMYGRDCEVEIYEADTLFRKTKNDGTIDPPIVIYDEFLESPFKRE